jgi:Fic family protein
MDPRLYQDSPIGYLERITVTDGDRTWEHHAFVPAPLPEHVDLSRQTWLATVEAAEAVARLDTAAGGLPNPYLLVRPSLTEEAVSTSALEGTYAAIEDVFQAELFEEDELPPELIEVRNYIRAAEHGLKLIETLPICLRLVKDVHRDLMSGGRGDSGEIGEFRRRQNWIGQRGDPVTDAVFVPPPAGPPLDDGLREWEKWVNAGHELPTVVQVALAHYQFETLHPFIDGNGRVGRLIAVLTFIASGTLRLPLLNTSRFLKDHKDEYVDHLRRVSQTGEFEPWIRFFADAVRVQADRSRVKSEELSALHRAIIERLHGEGIHGVALRIADDLLGSPAVTPTLSAKRYDVSYVTANDAIKRLVDLGVLAEITGRSYRRIFACTDVYRILSE